MTDRPTLADMHASEGASAFAALSFAGRARRLSSLLLLGLTRGCRVL